jgi:hypothetical protein
MAWVIKGLLPTILLSIGPAAVRADRIVLAPRGLITTPGTVRFEYARSASSGRRELGWINLGLTGGLNGVEPEAEHNGRPGTNKQTFSVQYTLTGNAFTDIAPAVSLGLRDALNEGREGRSLFIALTKTFGLSQAQERLLRDFKVHAGYGTSHLGGAFIGLQGRLPGGFTARAEYVARRVNASLALPLAHSLEAKVYSLDGQTYIGAGLSFSH